MLHTNALQLAVQAHQQLDDRVQVVGPDGWPSLPPGHAGAVHSCSRDGADVKCVA